MKRVCILILLTLPSVLMSAQESRNPAKVRYRGDVGLNAGGTFTYFSGEKAPTWMAFGAAASTTHGVEFNESATLGAGVGLGAALGGAWGDESEEVEVSPVISAYLHFDYAFCRGKKVRPWLGVRAGYGGTAFGSGVSAGPGMGIRIKNSWDIGLWYREIIGYDEGKYFLSHSPFLGFAWRFPGYKNK